MLSMHDGPNHRKGKAFLILLVENGMALYVLKPTMGGSSIAAACSIAGTISIQSGGANQVANTSKA